MNPAKKRAVTKAMTALWDKPGVPFFPKVCLRLPMAFLSPLLTTYV